MSNDFNLSRNGGLTTLDIARTLESDPAAAAQLGTYFRAQDSVRVQHRNLGTFDVQGDTESVNYGRTSSSDVAANMQGGPVMLGNAEYAISASGTIDKNGGWWGGDVSPTDTTSDGRTRLQVAVVKDGQVLRTENFRPDADGQMRITPRKGEEGATLGFFMLDGTDASERTDNSGAFKVSVDETTETRTASAIAVRAQDAEGIRVAGQQIAQAFETAPEAAYLPEPDRSLADCPAGRGIVRDTDNNSAVTTDGYVFRFEDNKVSIYAPDRDEPVSTFDGRNVTEADGTTWKAETGNYIAPNGALLRLEYDGNNLRNAELIHGDSRLKVQGPGRGDGAVALGPVEGGGYDRRRDLVEGDALGNSYRLGGANDRLDDLDVTWSVERRGADLGIVASGHDGQRGREVLERIPYFVAPELRPAFGTEDHERMLRSEIEDQRSTLSGLGQAQGATPDEARLVADYLLGPVSGQYQEYAERMAASRDAREIRNWLPGNESPEASRELIQQYQQQLMMQQLLGGLPAYFQDFPEAMAAIQQLVAVLASQASMQSDFQAGASNLRSYIPSVAAAQANQSAMAPEMVVDQALRGLNNRTGRNPLERFDLNSGAQYAARRVGRDPGAALIERRLQAAGVDTGPSRFSRPELERVAERLNEKLSRSLTDWAITDGDARDVAQELSHYGVRDLEQLARLIGPEGLSRLQDNLSDADKQTYAPLLERLTGVANAPTERAADPKAVAEELRGKLSYGALDWAVTESEARESIDRLSRLPVEDVSKVVSELGPELTSRMLDNLSEEDRKLYGPTIERVGDGRNFRREEVASTRQVVDDLRDKLTGIVTDNDARESIDQLSKLSDLDFREVTEQLGPDILSRLEEELTDEDKLHYEPTLARLRGAANGRGAQLSESEFSNAKERITDALTYGIGDWAVTDADARTAIAELARYDAAGFKKLVDSLDPGILGRIRDNLSDSDKQLYATTLDRLQAYAGV